jgi:Glycosyl transferase family 2
MGFRHIFFLDNGSTDQTITIAKQYENVSVCQSTLPIEANQGLFKRYLAERSAVGGWCVDADVDEFFDYPGSNVMDLGTFLDYLNRNQYTAVVTQLLDMFSDQPLSHLVHKQQEQLASLYQYYDLSDVERTKYRQAEFVVRHAAGNQVSNPETALLYGGIRKTLYGSEWLTNCLLTKHSMFRLGKGVELFPHVHFVNHARLADVSCVMLHYKLVSNALETALQNKESFSGIGKGYSDFIDFILQNPDHQIKQSTAAKFSDAATLIEDGFLFGSAKYREYVDSFAKSPALVQG